MNEVKNKLAIMRKLEDKVEILQNIGLSFDDIELINEQLEDITSQAQTIKKLEQYRLALSPAESLSQLYIEGEKGDMERLNGLIRRLESLEGKYNCLKVSSSIKTVEEVTMDNFGHLNNLVGRIEYLTSKFQSLSLSSDLQAVSILELPNTGRLLEKGKQIALLEKKLEILEPVLEQENILESNISDSRIGNLSASGRKISNLIKKQNVLLNNISSAEKEAALLNLELDEFIESNGGVCPTCNNQMSKLTHLECV